MAKYSFLIRDLPENKNVIADYLSRSVSSVGDEAETKGILIDDFLSNVEVVATSQEGCIKRSSGSDRHDR